MMIMATPRRRGRREGASECGRNGGREDVQRYNRASQGTLRGSSPAVFITMMVSWQSSIVMGREEEERSGGFGGRRVGRGGGAGLSKNQEAKGPRGART